MWAEAAALFTTETQRHREGEAGLAAAALSGEALDHGGSAARRVHGAIDTDPLGAGEPVKCRTNLWWRHRPLSRILAEVVTASRIYLHDILAIGADGAGVDELGARRLHRRV